MVFCCFHWPDPGHESVPENKIVSNPYDPAANYPGNRPTRLYATGGNALSGHPPHPAASYSNITLSNSFEVSQDLVAGKRIALTSVVMRGLDFGCKCYVDNEESFLILVLRSLLPLLSIRSSRSLSGTDNQNIASRWQWASN